MRRCIFRPEGTRAHHANGPTVQMESIVPIAIMFNPQHWLGRQTFAEKLFQTPFGTEGLKHFQFDKVAYNLIKMLPKFVWPKIYRLFPKKYYPFTTSAAQPTACASAPKGPSRQW